MADLPVIEDVYQVRWDWLNSSGPDPVNVMNYRWTGSGTESIADLTAAMNSNLDNDMFLDMANTVSLAAATITPLDGVTAGQVVTITPTRLGSESTNLVPEAAVIVAMQTPLRGPAGRGRIFLGPLGEGQVSNGVILATNLALMQTAWNDYIVNMEADGWALVVVHNGDLSDPPNASVANAVTSVKLRAYVGIQKRRLLATRI